MCACTVNDKMWIGSEMGHVYIYGADSRQQLAKVMVATSKREPVMCMMHSATNGHVRSYDRLLFEI